MKRIITLGGACILTLLFALPTSAQTPDLSGTWVYNPDKSILPNTERMDARPGGEISIKQEGETITITRQVRGRDGQTRSMDTVIIADGKPHEQSMGRMTTTVTASWKEGKLVVDTAMPAGRGGRGGGTRTETYTLRNNGTLLLIDSTDRQGNAISRAYDRKK